MANGVRRPGNNGQPVNKPKKEDFENHSKLAEAKFRKEDKEIRELLWSNGIYNRRTMGLYKSFSRIPIIDPDNALTHAKEYVFFTKPDLHLINRNNGDIADVLKPYPFFVDAVSRYREVCNQLQLSSNRIFGINSGFMPILSNCIKSELDVPDAEADSDIETGANDYGTKITYRGTSYASDQEQSFSIEFEDTKYLEVFMLFKIYDEYEKYKNLGLLELDSNNQDDELWINYTFKKILHDQFSIFKIIVGEDGESIIYFGKYTGVYPTGAPRSSFSSMQNQQGQSITVNFKAQFYRDMDPSIILGFNNLVESYNNVSKMRVVPITNDIENRFNGRWVTTAHIDIRDDYESSTGTKLRYKLKWLV